MQNGFKVSELSLKKARNIALIAVISVNYFIRFLPRQSPLEGRNLLEKEHREFIHSIAVTQEVKDSASLLSEVAEIEEAMRAIVAKALRSNDILYVCRFCKHLWR